MEKVAEGVCGLRGRKQQEHEVNCLTGCFTICSITCQIFGWSHWGWGVWHVACIGEKKMCM